MFESVFDLKDRVRSRDKNRCQCCGKTGYGKKGQLLHVHRIVPSQPYHYAFCITLCHACHMYMPKKPEDLLYKTYKGVYGIMIPRTSKNAQELISEIHKLILEKADNKDVGVMFFGIGEKERKTGTPPKKLFFREDID